MAGGEPLAHDGNLVASSMRVVGRRQRQNEADYALATASDGPYGTRCAWGGLCGSAVLTAEGPGPKLVLVDCPACGHDNRALAKFCDACGQLLEPGVALGQPDPRSYTPAPLAEKMRRQRPSEGERRIVTVLFIDTVGSTPLAEKLGEEDMYSLMRECLSRMSEAVHHYEGHVANFTGDGMMALFGAPIAHEDSARRAVVAALRMQHSLGEYAAEVEQRHGVECHFRVGLNTGPVVVGTVTDDLRMDFTAIGDTVNLAARMEQMADPGSVLVSEHTHQVVADFVECEPLGGLAVKGKVGPVGAYRVLREKPVRTRLEAAAERGLSPLVGRDRELAVLEAHLELARHGSGRVVVVSGEAGIGKSRLILELRRRLASEPVGWVEGHSISYGRNSAYLPVVDLLKGAFGVEEGDDDAQIIRRVDEVVSHWEEPARLRASYLKYLLSVDPGDEAVTAMDPQERRVEIFEAVCTLILQESRRRPLVVVLEDLHWADQMSQEALGALVAVVPSASVLLVLSHRPGYAYSWGGRSDLSSLALDHLDEGESVALTQGVLQVESLPPEVQRLVTAKAEGNPFFIEEVSKALVEMGVVARVNGSYRLQRAFDEIHIPETIQEVILARIDRLEREAKEAMQLASVIGREFTARLLDRISDPEAKLSEVLGELKALELIYEKAFFPELAYMFKHALTHDVAYAMLLAERRRILHGLVGAAIEELYGDRLVEHYETLAHHYSEGRDWDKALDYLAKAGDKAAAAFANQDALDFYAHALEVAETLGGEALASSPSIAARRGFVNFGIGSLPGAVADFDRMVQAACHLGERSLEATALGYRGLAEFWSHEFERAEATLGRARSIVDEGHEEVRPLVSLALANLFLATNRVREAEPLLSRWGEDVPKLPDPFTQGAWSWLSGIKEQWVGRFDEALRILERMPEDAERLIFNRLINWWGRGLTLGAKGEYERALGVLGETLSTCERVGDALIRARVLNTVGWIYGELEDHEGALEWNRRGVEAAQAIIGWPDPELEMNARLNLGDNLQALGHPDEAEEQFRLVEAVFRDPKPAEHWMLWRYSQHLLHSYGELWLKRGESARAIAYAEECLELAESSGSTKNVVKGRRLRAQALAAQGRLDEAEQELSVALEVAIELGNPPQLWKTHAAAGDLRRARGRTEHARRAYGEALSVIEHVAVRLTDERRRETFLQSKQVQGIRQAVEARS
ncbi:MAG: ATP-binding protein [Acidimicrobiia bacterium]